MPTQSAGLDHDVLTAALEGLEAQKRKIEEQMQHVRSLLGIGVPRRGRPPKSAGSATPDQAPAAAGGRRRRRRLSAEARARISAAQKKRWASAKKSGK